MMRATRRRFLAAGASSAGLVIAGCLGGDDTRSTDFESDDTVSTGFESDDSLRVTAAVQYMGPNCTCCEGYAEYFEERLEGTLETETVPDLASVKSEYGIAPDLRSCHTVELDGYLVEGHIPTEPIGRLLAEEPDIRGISLPGMPQGTPGMPGEKDTTWTVYSLDGAVYTEL